MILKPQDVLITAKIAVVAGEPLTFQALAQSLAISTAEAHDGVRRCARAGLLTPRPLLVLEKNETTGAVRITPKPDKRRARFVVRRAALLELFIHGIKYVFVPERGAMTRGMPTAHAIPEMRELLGPVDVVPVWPDPNGSVRGEELEPIYRTAPHAARQDAKLYVVLALLDAIRIGRVRERKLARTLLEQHIPEAR